MRIEKLRLKNFRAFEEKEFSFSPQFNLLVGDNGSGKTAILDALSIAIGSWLLGIGGIDTRSIKEEEVRKKMISFEDSINFEPQYPVIVEAAGEVAGVHLKWARSINKKRGRTTRIGAKELEEISIDAEKKVSEGKTVNLPVVSYYGVGRLWLRPQEYSKIEPRHIDSRLEGYSFSHDPRLNEKDLVGWIKNQQYQSLQEGNDSAGFTAVKAAIVSCIDKCNRLDYIVKSNQLVVDIQDQGIQPFSQLSDGQRNMLAMVGDIAFKAAILNPHFGDQVLQKTEGVVLIDEIDIHLHPAWQRHVIEDLRHIFPKIQFIATTHSPFIVQSLREEELINLSEKKPVEMNVEMALTGKTA
ncbi:MAG: AAA family ATPase [bacterium]|nr:AAA family ATPase [bacterium]